MIELTERAREALVAAASAATRFDPDARIRLGLREGRLVAELREGPEPGDSIEQVHGLSLIVQAGLEGVVDAGDHNLLTLRSA